MRSAPRSAYSPTWTETESIVSGTDSTSGARRGLSSTRMNPARSAPASAATSTSSWRVSPQTLTSGREINSASFSAGPSARISTEPTRIASAPASSAAAPWPRDEIPLSATMVRSRGALATSSSCDRRSIRKLERSRALIPIVSAPSWTARSSSCASCALTSASKPSSCAVCRSAIVLWSSRSRNNKSAALAPAVCASARCSRVEKNPLASSGRLVALRAAFRSSKEPPKRWSTRIDTAAAPARSNSAASAAGSASGRRSPAEGERRLTSAIAPSPGRRSASAKRNQHLQSLSGRAGLDRLAGELQALAQVLRVSTGGDRAGRVQEDRVAPAAVATGEDLPDRSRVLFRRATPKLLRRAASDSQLHRIDLPLPDATLDDLVDEVRARRGELVDPAGPVDDECTPCAECGQHLGEGLDQIGRVDPDDLGPGARGVRQRPENVEDRSGRELLPHRRRVLHRRMVRGRKQEAETEGVDRVRDPLGRKFQLEAERFEDIGRAGGGRDRAVPVLCDPSAGRRRHQRRRGRDVERAAAVAARPGSVDEIVALRVNREHVCPHRLGAASDLVGRLALQPQRDKEAADLGGRRVATHDRVHRLTRLVAGEVVSVEQPGKGRLHQCPSRKLRARSGPTGVSTDSGWNWTPSTRSSRWRTAITSPSSHVAETWSSSGIDVAASEW